MHILAFVLFFVIGSIAAASKGDFSGVEVIGKVLGFLFLIIGMMWLFTQPAVLLVVMVIVALIVICCCTSK